MRHSTRVLLRKRICLIFLCILRPCVDPSPSLVSLSLWLFLPLFLWALSLCVSLCFLLFLPSPAVLPRPCGKMSTGGGGPCGGDFCN